MGRNRRLARITDSEDEEEGEFKSRRNPPSKKKKKKLVEEPESEEDEPEEDEPEEEEEEEEEEPEEEEEEEEIPEAKPIGEVIKVTGKGKNRRSHFQAFEYDGNTFELEDSVLLTPEEAGQKPYVAIIKEITQAKDGGIHVLGQWFYRPEEAEKKGGGSWEGRDTRELFYSFHHDEIPAESVMHKCQAHFIPLHKQIPDRSVHPGFIVQKVYDTVEKKLWKLTDKDYEDNKQHEIDILVQKTQQRLGEIPDLAETEDVVDQEDKLKDRRNLKRKDMAPIDVSREDGETFRTDQILTADTPGSVTGEGSELYKTLTKFKALTGESIRDKWLERLLQAIQCVCDPNENVQDGNNEKGGSASIDHKEIIKNHQSVTDVAEVTGRKDGGAIRWPDDAVPAVVALEKAANGAFDYQKFNQKMRQMVFNLRSSARLTRRLINGELEASVVLHMSPNELKEGLTAQETAPKEPEESERMQMTDARCQRCHEKRVGLTDIIQAGARGDRYQLECIGCGNTWYAFRDEVSTLTIDAPSVAGNVGTAPWATKKFENVEKKLVSPRESEKPSPDIFQKTTAAKAPVLDQQTSFKKQKTEEAPSAAQNKSE